MKQYYFISGLPRSGSTLLSAILRQNPEFYADITSALKPMTDALTSTICTSDSNPVISEYHRKDIMYGVFDGYYKYVKKSIIIDTNREWTRKTHFLKTLFPYTKLLCTVRDIVPILNSFETMLSKNPFYDGVFCSGTGYKNIFERCDNMMHKEHGIVSQPYMNLCEGYAANSEMIMLIEYENLCKEPEKTMRKVYKFLEKPYFNHDFDNVEYSNETFDIGINSKGLHTVKRKVQYDPPKNILPPEITKKYSEMKMEFWKKDSKLNFNFN